MKESRHAMKGASGDMLTVEKRPPPRGILGADPSPEPWEKVGEFGNLPDAQHRVRLSRLACLLLGGLRYELRILDGKGVDV